MTIISMIILFSFFLKQERLWSNPPQFVDTIAEGIRTQQVKIGILNSFVYCDINCVNNFVCNRLVSWPSLFSAKQLKRWIIIIIQYSFHCFEKTTKKSKKNYSYRHRLDPAYIFKRWDIVHLYSMYGIWRKM